MTNGGDPVAERRVLSAGERLEEALFTGLRLSEGIDLDAFATRYGVDIGRGTAMRCSRSSRRDGSSARGTGCD